MVEISIKEGEMFLLPAKIPHSPVRPKNSIGLVIEAKRQESEMDGLQWYCDNCGNLLHEVTLQLKNIVSQLPPLFNNYWNNIDSRTCSNCGEIQDQSI